MATSMYWEIFTTAHKSSHPPAIKTSAFVLFGPKSDQLEGTRGLQLLYLVHLEPPRKRRQASEYLFKECNIKMMRNADRG